MMNSMKVSPIKQVQSNLAQDERVVDFFIDSLLTDIAPGKKTWVPDCI